MLNQFLLENYNTIPFLIGLVLGVVLFIKVLFNKKISVKNKFLFIFIASFFSVFSGVVMNMLNNSFELSRLISIIFVFISFSGVILLYKLEVLKKLFDKFYTWFKRHIDVLEYFFVSIILIFLFAKYGNYFSLQKDVSFLKLFLFSDAVLGASILGGICIGHYVKNKKFLSFKEQSWIKKEKKFFNRIALLITINVWLFLIFTNNTVSVAMLMFAGMCTGGFLGLNIFDEDFKTLEKLRAVILSLLLMEIAFFMHNYFLMIIAVVSFFGYKKELGKFRPYWKKIGKVFKNNF